MVVCSDFRYTTFEEKDVPYKVNEPVEPQQRAVIDDDQLKRMMADSQPSFFERNRYRLVTLALIAINVAVFEKGT